MKLSCLLSLLLMSHALATVDPFAPVSNPPSPSTEAKPYFLEIAWGTFVDSSETPDALSGDASIELPEAFLKSAEIMRLTTSGNESHWLEVADRLKVRAELETEGNGTFSVDLNFLVVQAEAPRLARTSIDTEVTLSPDEWVVIAGLRSSSASELQDSATDRNASLVAVRLVERRAESNDTELR
ncbi:MAG: hypothetical protein ACFB21_07760 [Opitutales bacterium]